MKVEELKPELEKYATLVEKQQAYVAKLADMFAQGQTTIKIFDDQNNVWTVVPLAEFHATQHNKWVALSTYHGILSGAYVAMQQVLDQALTGQPVPA